MHTYIQQHIEGAAEQRKTVVKSINDSSSECVKAVNAMLAKRLDAHRLKSAAQR
jgi:hypothetical protein